MLFVWVAFYYAFDSCQVTYRLVDRVENSVQLQIALAILLGPPQPLQVTHCVFFFFFLA